MSNQDALGIVGLTVADKYRVESMVGEGGFAVVYRATHLIWKRPVALKVFKALGEVAESEHTRLLDDFIREGALLAELSEKTTSICQARDAGMLTTSAGKSLPYMVLEWLEGRSLEAVLHDERERGEPPRTIEQAVRLLEPAAEALVLAHKQGIAHRDVKPANLFLLGEPRGEGCPIKLLDFGIAKVVQDAQKMGGAFTKTQGQITSFTPAYGAPEQFSRSHGSTGPWTDVFALALVLVELVTGRPPLEGDEFMQIAYASQDRSVRPTPRAKGATVSDEIEAVFATALAVSPNDRYRHVGSFWTALRAAARLEPMRSSVVSASGTVVPTPVTRDSAGPVVSPRAVPTPVQPPGGAGNAVLGTSQPWVSSGGDAPQPSPSTPSAGGALAATDSTAFASTHLSVREPGSVTGAATSQPAREPPTEPSRKTVSIVAVAGACTLIGALGGAYAYLRSGQTGEGSASAASPSAASSGAAASAQVAASGSQAVPQTTPSPAPSRCPPGMLHIDGGQFFMGSDDDLPQEKPAHNVTLASFCIDRFEVTTAAYLSCSNDGKCKRASKVNEWDGIKPHDRDIYDPLCNIRDPEGRAKHPINCVDWEMADTYCRAEGGRLPTEAEWEFAARGPDGRRYPWGDDDPTSTHLNACGTECVSWGEKNKIDLKAMYKTDDGFPNTAPVGSFPAGKSRYGLEDVVGNVWEWVADWSSPYTAAAQSNPRGPAAGKTKVIRGGAWNGSEPAWVRPTFRYWNDPKTRSHGVGFRCAADPKT